MTDLPDNCPHCGGPAHRITPMGFWEKATGYSPKGVRYVCGKLYLDPPEPCPGRETFYGDDAEEKALVAWNTRATTTPARVDRPTPAQVKVGQEVADLLFDAGVVKALGGTPVTSDKHQDLIDLYLAGEILAVEAIYMGMNQA